MRGVFPNRAGTPDLDADVRRIVDLLDRGPELLATAGECVPPLDVIETTGGLDVQLDVPGIRAAALHVLVARQTLVIAGDKAPAGCEHRDAAFHLAERRFGRFLRAVKLPGSWDLGAAEARLSCGVLRIRLPRIVERRGGEIRIPVQVA